MYNFQHTFQTLLEFKVLRVYLFYQELTITSVFRNARCLSIHLLNYYIRYYSDVFITIENNRSDSKTALLNVSANHLILECSTAHTEYRQRQLQYFV